jgi:hypothetical protein
MPPEASDPVLRWRALAEEAQTIADQMTDPQAKLILLTIARGYDRLAQRAAARKAQADPDITDPDAKD